MQQELAPLLRKMEYAGGGVGSSRRSSRSRSYRSSRSRSMTMRTMNNSQRRSRMGVGGATVMPDEEKVQDE